MPLGPGPVDACRPPAGSGSLSRIEPTLRRLDSAPEPFSREEFVTAIRTRAVLALALSVGAACPAAASESPWALLSPWTLNRSGYFFQTTASYLSTSDFYDNEGFKQSSTAKFRDLTTNLHLEYGVRNKLGLVLGVPVRHLKLDLGAPPDLTNTGIGDLLTGLRYRIAVDPAVVSAQLEAKFPTGYNAVLQTPALGEGQTDVTGRLLLGHSFEDVNGWAQVAGGYRRRFKDISDEILFNADAGTWVADRAQVAAHWEYIRHTGEGEHHGLIQGGATGRYRAWRRFDVTGGIFHVFGGENEPAGTRFFLGLTARGNALGKYEGPLSSSLAETPAPKPAAAAPAPAPAPKVEATPAPPPAPETPTPSSPDTTQTPKG